MTSNKLIRAIIEEPIKAIAKEPIRAKELLVKNLAKVNTKLTYIKMPRLPLLTKELAKAIKKLIKETTSKKLAIIFAKRFVIAMPALSRVLEIEFFRGLIPTKHLATKLSISFRSVILLEPDFTIAPTLFQPSPVL